MAFRVSPRSAAARVLSSRQKLRGARVHVPAQVIEFRLRGQLAYLREVLLLHVHESDDHVGDLHTSVVDVVLYLHRAASVPQHTRDGVAQHRVSHVPNVRRLIRINAGVLNNNFAGTIRYRGPRLPRVELLAKSLRGQNRHSDIQHPQLQLSQSLRWVRGWPRFLARSAVARASAVLPIQKKPAKPPRPFRFLAGVP